eukprot:c5261_g1_i1 orf=161-2083(+)
MGRPRTRRAPQESSGRSGRKNKGRTGSKNVHVTTIDDFDDDIDKFHKGADKISLDVNNDLELSEDDMEEPVFDLKAESSSEEDDDEDSDDDDFDEEELSGLAAKMAKQAKILRQKTSLMEDEEEDEAEEEEEGRKEKKAAWGKRKKMYYSADNVDYELQSSDEEAPAEEEAEALRLQRQIAERLRPEDFDIDEDDDEGRSSDENEKTLQEVVEKSKGKSSLATKSILSKRRLIDASTKDENILVEEVKKDVSALSREEQMNVVMSDAPELVGLLAELREGLDELHNKIEPLLVKVKGCSNANKGGLRFLETKRMLLLCYSQSILFYLLMKAEGHSVRDHPVIARLVEIRTLLQKLQPIDKKLQNQIDKLLTSSVEWPPASKVEAHENPKPSIQLSVSSSKRKEISQAPDATLLDREGLESSPAKISEEMFTETRDTDTHAPTNALQRRKPRAIAQSDEEDDALPENNSLHRIISTKIQKRKPHVISGDMDLPLKEELGVRRAKLEMRKVPYHANKDDSDEEEDRDLDEGEDEFYQEAKRLKVAKQAAKERNSTKIISQEPIAEEEVGKRHISYQMEKNKGLTPHRKKLTKNPRKKYKLKHQKAVIRRKGQVRDIKRPSESYGGESTGIRTTISRSRRFNS